MRVFWLNGGLFLEPQDAIESEAMLVLLRHIKYQQPVGHDEDGRHAPQDDKSGSVERGGDIAL